MTRKFGLIGLLILVAAAALAIGAVSAQQTQTCDEACAARIIANAFTAASASDRGTLASISDRAFKQANDLARLERDLLTALAKQERDLLTALAEADRLAARELAAYEWAKGNGRPPDGHLYAPGYAKSWAEFLDTRRAVAHGVLAYHPHPDTAPTPTSTEEEGS